MQEQRSEPDVPVVKPVEDEMKLIPCPWCGDAGKPRATGHHGRFWVTCDMCKLGGPERHSQEAAIEAWQDRPALEAAERRAEAAERWGDIAIEVLEKFHAGNWDRYYGHGLSEEYAQRLSRDIKAAIAARKEGR